MQAELTKINVKLERLLYTHGVILEFRGTTWHDPAVSLGNVLIVGRSVEALMMDRRNRCKQN